MKRMLIAIIILELSSSVYSQEIKFFNQRPVRNISIGLGGDGGVISLNHEKLYLISFKLMLANEIGVGCTQDFSILNPNNYYLSLPFNVSVCLGKRQHLLELGLGSTVYLTLNDSFYEYSISPIVGYRIQPLKPKKVSFKIFAAIPYNLDFEKYINLKNSEIFFIPLGISMGKSF